MKWLTDTFGIDNNTASTILITVIVFGAGIAVTALSDFVKIWHRRSMLKKVTLNNLKSLRSRLLEQSKSFYATADQFGQLSSTSIKTQRAEFENIQILKEIGYDQAYQAFFYGVYNFKLCRKKSRLKSFQKIWEIIYSLTFWQEKAIRDFDQFLDKYSSYNALRNETVLNLGEQLHQIFSTSFKGKNQISAELESEILSIHSHWAKLPFNSSPKVLNLNLTLPLLNLFTDYGDTEWINPIRRSLNEEVLYTKNILNLESTSTIQFRHFGSLSKTRAKQLEIIIKTLG